MQVTCGPVSSVRGKRGVASHLHRALRSRLQRAGRSLSTRSRSATATHYVLVDVEIRVPYEERLASPEKTYRVRIVYVSCQYRGGILSVLWRCRGVSRTYRDVLWRYRVRIVTYCRGIGYVLRVSCTYRDVLWRYRVRILTYLVRIVEVSFTYRDMSRTYCGHIVYYRVPVTYH